MLEIIRIVCIKKNARRDTNKAVDEEAAIAAVIAAIFLVNKDLGRRKKIGRLLWICRMFWQSYIQRRGDTSLESRVSCTKHHWKKPRTFSTMKLEAMFHCVQKCNLIFSPVETYLNPQRSSRHPPSWIFIRNILFILPLGAEWMEWRSVHSGIGMRNRKTRAFYILTILIPESRWECMRVDESG